MKTRNVAIIILLMIAMAVFTAVKFWVMPAKEAAQEKYLMEQQSPETHDLQYVLEYRSPYMGDAGNLINLFNHLPLSEREKTFELFPDERKAAVIFSARSDTLAERELAAALLYNSTVAFALIGNLEAIDYRFSDAVFSTERKQIEQLYPDGFDSLLQKDSWKENVQLRIIESGKVSEMAERVFNKH